MVSKTEEAMPVTSVAVVASVATHVPELVEVGPPLTTLTMTRAATMTTTTPTATQVKSPAGRPLEAGVDLGAETVLATMLLVTGVPTNLVEIRGSLRRVASYVGFGMVQILARPASTIVVIRDQNAVLEILMLRRSSEVAAASGAHVFPGGGVDAVDADIAERGLVTGLDDETAARRLNLDSGAMPYYCAALRELFEEAGLLLAVESDGRPLSVENGRLVAWRSDLATGRVTWPELLEHE